MKMLFRMRKAIHRKGTCLFLLYQQNLSICSIPLQIGALHFPCGSFSPLSWNKNIIFRRKTITLCGKKDITNNKEII